MDDVKSDRFAVLSSGLVVPRLEEIEQRFIATWVRMKQNVKPGYRRAQLSYQDERKAKGLAANAHARRLREAGLSSLPKDAHAGVMSLARDGAALSGPATDDEVYRLVADLHAESGWMREVSTWVMKHMLAHVGRGGQWLSLPPVILTGPPGIGKSHFARRLADLAGVPSRIIDVGGGSAGFRIVGTERGWATALPGIPVETILASRIANCVMIVDEVDKPAMLKAGEWQATAPGDGRTAGFHLPALLSPFETWAEIAREHTLVVADPSRLKSWVNTKLGETWEEAAAQDVDITTLTSRAENWAGALPEGVAAITAGIDTQDGWLAVELVGWGVGEESWSLDWIRLHGDPTSSELWADLEKILARTFQHPKAGPLPIAAACIDSGGHFTARVLDFTTPRHSQRVYAIKGASRPGLAAWPHRPSVSKHGKKPMYLIGVDTLKEIVFPRLAKGEAGRGFVHIPQGREPAWFGEMTAEKPYTKYSKARAVREWRKKSGDRNEAFDCRVYAAAALESLNSSGFDLDAEAKRIAGIGAAPAPVKQAQVIRSTFMQGR